MAANMYLAKSHEKQCKIRFCIRQSKKRKKKKRKRLNFFVSAKTWITITIHEDETLWKAIKCFHFTKMPTSSHKTRCSQACFQFKGRGNVLNTS